jgi:16S rRNA (cytosine967-C5)-methyltransferase
MTRVVRHDWRRGAVPASLAGVAPVDRILIDAPCSNTGVMRRRVDVRWRLRPDEFKRMQSQQLSIVRSAIFFLKPGGVLVYSTCSLEPEENREVVERLVRELPLRLEQEKECLPFRDNFDGAYAARLIKVD